MKDVRKYLSDAMSAREPLLVLLERVQREAYQAGYAKAGDQMLGIAHDTKQRVDDMTARLLSNGHHG